MEFQDTVFCGMTRASVGGIVARDNIYTAGHAGQLMRSFKSPPRDAQDSVLLPTFMDGPMPAAGSVRPIAAPAPAPRQTPPAPVAPPVTPPRRTPGAVDVHFHHTTVSQSAPAWVVVLVTLGLFVLLAGSAVFVIVVARSATRAVPAQRPAPFARAVPPPHDSRPC